MKFLLAVLLIAFLFWLPWDRLTTFSDSTIPITGAEGSTYTVTDTTHGSGATDASAGNSPAAGPVTGENPLTDFGGANADPCAQRYYIQVNDTLRQIAARCGMSLEALLAANPVIINPDFIEEGQIINIPRVVTASGLSVAPPTGIIPNTGQGTLVVQEGDTLGTIALRYDLTLSQLLAVNPQITNPNRIYAGQQIYLPADR